MKQHPVPQHIASYEFRLIGDMTIRQFGMLASGCIVALIFYASPLPGYFKWPVVIFFIVLGVALAFIPVEERPLHRWLIAFFKAVYSPTQFLWKKQLRKPEIFKAVPAKPAAKKPTPPPDQAKLTQYLQTLPEEKSPLEKAEESFLEKITNLFQLTKMPAVAPPPTPPPVQPVPIKPIEPSPPPIKEVPRPKPKVVPRPTPPPAPPKPKRPFKLKVEPEKREPAVEAKISPGLPFPQTPKTPNLLVGMVLDSEGKIIEGAILEIRNSEGIPVRALKTNKLGQFRIVTQLKNDTYEIETEKEGYTFDIIKVEVKGKPVQPIEIRAKEAVHETRPN